MKKIFQLIAAFLLISESSNLIAQNYASQNVNMIGHWYNLRSRLNRFTVYSIKAFGAGMIPSIIANTELSVLLTERFSLT